MWVSTLLGLLAILLLVLGGGARIWRSLAWLGAAVWLAFGSFYAGANYFTGQGVNDAVLFHLPLIFSWRTIIKFPQYSLAAGVVLLFVIMFLIIAWHSLVKRSNYQRSFGAELALILIAVALLRHPLVGDVMFIYEERSKQGEDILLSQIVFDRHTQQRPTRSLIYLYLESLDSVFFDEQRFPGLLPQLKLLMAEQALIFTGIEQVRFTEWTMAGMISSQCGTPLIRQQNADWMRSEDHTYCIGEYLKRNQYNLVYMGANIDFAGKQDFYKNQFFDEVFGSEQIQYLLGGVLPQSEWGIHDDDLFKFAEAKIDSLVERSQPFAAIMLTVDTHPPAGYVSQSCRDIQYGDGTNQLLNVVHCYDGLLSALLQRWLDNPAYDEVLIVIGSDHLMMENDAGIKVGGSDRRNTLAFFNVEKGTNSRHGNLFDVAPTVLQALGADVRAWGFGRSLFQPQPTLTEKYGLTDFDPLLLRWRRGLEERMSGK